MSTVELLLRKCFSNKNEGPGVPESFKSYLQQLCGRFDKDRHIEPGISGHEFTVNFFRRRASHTNPVAYDFDGSSSDPLIHQFQQLFRPYLPSRTIRIEACGQRVHDSAPKLEPNPALPKSMDEIIAALKRWRSRLKRRIACRLYVSHVNLKATMFVH